MYAGRISVDFQNLDDEHRVRLNTAGTVRDLAALGITPTDGMTLPLYTDDADDDGNPDPLLADGVTEFDAAAGCWVARVDWLALRHASRVATAVASNGRQESSVTALEPTRPND